MIGQPFKLVIRTKYLLYGLVTAYGISGVNLISEAVVVFCIIHLFFAVAGFCKLRRILGNSDAE